jgi:hypothetical protein
MAALTDLWGNLDTEELVRTPVSILKEQASLLGKKTGNVIEARVETSFSGGEFSHRLLLVAPALDGYTYELLKFYHRAELYPVLAAGMQLDDEELFMKWLGTKLSSAETHRIITNLLSQSRS